MVRAMPLTESYWPADTSRPLLDLTVGDMLRRAAAEVPDETALVAAMSGAAEHRSWTYAQLLADSERAARALLSRFEPGERIAVWAPNIPEWIQLEFGAAFAGLVLVTVNPAFKPAELEYVLSQSRSSGLFFTPEYRGNPMAASVEAVRGNLPELRELISFSDWDDFIAAGQRERSLPPVSPDDAVQIQYTSGTTGFPKGALLHHRGITNNAAFTVDRLDIPSGAAWVHGMPMFHTAGCVLNTLGPVHARAKHVCLYAFDPALMLELIERERAFISGGVPTMLIAMMEHPDFPRRDLSSLRVVFSGGATVPADVVRRIETSLGARFSIVFGQTETSPVITQTRLDDSPEDKAETIGQALPHTEVKIVDSSTGATVPIGTTGELCTRGYLVMKEYFEMPDATAATIDADGWLHTGDLCAMDERGYCTVEGRLKDMIIRGGENVYPREIEELLYTHPGVVEVAVVGVPDPKWGEQVAAFVRATPEAKPTGDELFDFVRARLAPHKTPRHWVFVDEFPLTGSGKIQKFVLRERWEKGELERHRG